MWALKPAADGRQRTAASCGYTSETMTVSSTEALAQLDALRERLKDASERLGWLRSYL
jgi:hypothetical protein